MAGLAAIMLVVVALGCGGPRAPAAVACAAELAGYQIDVTAEPRICEPLREAVRALGPAARARVEGLVVVRNARGPCGDQCPDLASALLSDAALAYYAVGRHQLHVVDATFAGPRWRGGQPAPAAIRAYLDELGLPDWAALVARVRTIPGVSLPADVPEGAPELFDAIVRHGPAALLGGEVPLAQLLLHELGHAVLLGEGADFTRVQAWSSLSGWGERDGELADGFVGGSYSNERPIVASRVLLGLPRGDDAYYRPGALAHPRAGGGLVSGYAAFDPIEDHAESFRMIHADPVALGQVSPAKLLVAGAGEVDLRAPALRRFVRPGVEALLDVAVDPVLAMATLRAHGAALLPEVADLADPRPLPIPEDADGETRAAIAQAALIVAIGPYQFRPTDAAFAAYLARWSAARRDYEEFQRGLQLLRGE